MLIMVCIMLTISGQSAEAGNQITCDGQVVTIVGTPDNDELIGTPENDVIAGLDGRDRIFALDGDDHICGGGDDDSLYGENGEDVIRGGRGSDFIGPGRHDDQAYGGPGNEDFDEGPGNDYIDGGSHVRPFVTLGIHTRIGGDEVLYGTSPHRINLDLEAETATGWGMDQIIDIESAQGSNFRDVLAGNDRPNDLDAWGGVATSSSDAEEMISSEPI